MDLEEVEHVKFLLGTMFSWLFSGCITVYQLLFSTFLGKCKVMFGDLLVVILQSGITINGWLRDFLWAQSSQVLTSYGQSISMYGLMFLGAHFIWAFSLMFLFSGRGYWQELFESIVWAHNKLKVAPTIQPRALSITQGRAVGVLTSSLGVLQLLGLSSMLRLFGLG